jgi:hypothetical protein
VVSGTSLDLTIDGIALQQVHEVTCLGLKIDENLTWKGHVLNKFTCYEKGKTIFEPAASH